MSQHTVGAGKVVSIDINCVEDDQRILGATDEFLTKKDVEQRNRQDAGNAKINSKGTPYVCRSSREGWAALLQRRHRLKWRTKNER